MIEIIDTIEKFNPIITTVIGGIITFFITKYTYHKNIPLDKLEITYNRIYYPLYKLIKDENDISLIIDKSKNYFNKYNKYIDKSTLKAFNILCQSDTNAKRERAYQNFKNNIDNRNSYLRRRLGYLEPGIFQMYTYSSPTEKSMIRILLEFCFIYFLVIATTITKNNIQIIFIYLLILSTFIFIVEIVWLSILKLYYKIKK